MLLRKHTLAVIAALFSVVALAAPIKKIDVTGNRRIEPDAIKEKMKLKPGSELTPEAVREDILSIFSLGYFEDVRMDQDDDGSVLVTVRERPVMSEIKYVGSDEFEQKDLDDATGLKAFTVVNLSKIRAAQTAIAKKYEEKGYYLARADYELKPIPGKPNEVTLVFNIQENEKVRVRKIFFLGNRVFTSGDLKKIMFTSEGNVFSWASGGGTYREGAFDRDLSALAYFYGNEGYIEAKFTKPRVTLSQDRRYVDIFIDVEEGKKFYLGETTFRGDLLFSVEDLRKSFGIKEKDVFSTGKLQEEVLKLTDKYGDEGYAFANVIPRPQVREGTDIVDLSFDIEKGEKVYWGKITVTGNSKTHDKVVRRELPFSEGELYNATKRKKGLERIRRLGFFGSDVNFLTSTPPGSTNILNLEIRISEKPTGSLNVSAGWGSAQGLVFSAQVSQNNLLGLGQQLSFSASWMQAGSRTLSLGFTDPHIFDSNWLGGSDFYIQDNPVGYFPAKSYDQYITGGDVRLGREIFENVNLIGTYKLERDKLFNPVNPLIFTSPTEANSLISSVMATISYDTRNNRLDPSDGEYLSGSTEIAGLGGRSFQKYVASARMYRRLGWKFVYRTNLEYGLLTNSFTNDNVPDTERFILGGIFSLRGYTQSSVGPVKNLPNTRKNSDGTWENQLPSPPNPANTLNPQSYPFVIGGTHKLIFNNEIEFPLIPDADIRAVVFFDTGNAWGGPGGTQYGPALLSNLGWGIRWYSPLGPLRFEWGYPLTHIPTSQDDPAFQFVIAPTF